MGPTPFTNHTGPIGRIKHLRGPEPIQECGASHGPPKPLYGPTWAYIYEPDSFLLSFSIVYPLCCSLSLNFSFLTLTQCKLGQNQPISGHRFYNEKKSIIVLIFLDMLMRQGFPIFFEPFCGSWSTSSKLLQFFS